MSWWDELTHDEQAESLMEAIDVLAILYPLENSPEDCETFLAWVREMIEMRAPKVRDDDPANDA